jgi:hypothetical protein
MNITTYFGIGVGIVLLILLGYWIFKSFHFKKTEGIIKTPISAGSSVDSSTKISYMAWLKVNDFTTNNVAERRIFSANGCPEVLLGMSSNNLVVKTKTIDGETETITIDNLPAKKWFHLIVQINQDSVKVYINGILKEYHTLSKLPKMGKCTILTGSDWSGEMNGLSYVNIELAETDIAELVGKSPDSSPSNYFSLSWYLQ